MPPDTRILQERRIGTQFSKDSEAPVMARLEVLVYKTATAFRAGVYFEKGNVSKIYKQYEMAVKAYLDILKESLV